MRSEFSMGRRSRSARVWRWASGLVGVLLLLGENPASLARSEVHFGREILPILSEHCFACHGPDAAKRKADLRLDTADGAMAERKGGRAVVPGDPAASRLIARIESRDPDEVMPPPNAGKTPLSLAQRALLRRWIAEKAPWGRHWSLEPPRRAAPSPATGRLTDAPPPHFRPRNEIDPLIWQRLQEVGLTPSPEAPKHVLLRRLSFDLTGLPPTLEELDAFERDTAPEVYERRVEQLLRSPHFGERMAMWWLDAARYADTDGFQGEAERTNWPWRDWVVAAFNANRPFDQFTVEQFAGDLLPDATPEQILATCFHRNHMTNGEGGRDPEESRVDYVIDRVNTVGTTWLGLTLGCVQCHAHKFDPLAQADYYRVAAFFNSIDEDGKAGSDAKPFLAYRSPYAARALVEAEAWVAEQQAAEVDERRRAEQRFESALVRMRAAVASGYQAWQVLTPTSLVSAEGTEWAMETDGSVRATGPNPRQDDYRFSARVSLPRVTGLRLEVLPDPRHTLGRFSRGASGEFILTDVKVQVRRRGQSVLRDIGVSSVVADAATPQKNSRAYGDVKGVLDDDPRNGWTTEGVASLGPRTAVLGLAEPLRLRAGEELIFEMRHRSTLGDANIGRFRLSATDQAGEPVRSLGSAPLEDLAKVGPVEVSALDPTLRARLLAQFLEDDEAYQRARGTLERAERQRAEVKKAAASVNVMVLRERPEPRETFVLQRGVWDQRGERVERGVPEAVAPWPEGLEKSRLGLARWLVSPENPLTARVVANHLWQLIFGAGLVRTPEDFGTQGAAPTHPELLDWLAVELRECGWDVKHLLRLMVTSATYRQSSAASPEQWARDPENRWLGRSARFRWPSWMLRDAALRVSGLLNPAVGGPPVRPYQPEGVWEELFMGRFPYEPSDGSAQYRRTLYAFWRRAIAPTFLFDTAQRRVCEVRTPRTNTPLQALTLLNDQTYLEAALTLAAGALRWSEGEHERVQFLYRAVLARPASADEWSRVEPVWAAALAHYRGHREDAVQLRRLAPGLAETELDAVTLAAYAVVANLVLNLDEALSRE